MLRAKSQSDEFFMSQALALAEKGRGFVSPNPLVGAVVVKNGKIIGKGYHKQFGKAHAEVNALADAKGKTKGAALYVTLEPCTFYGKTPACVNAVLNSGVTKVVVATKDPHSKVLGKGIEILRKAGIKTKVGVLAKQARKQNESYFKFVKKRLPFVILKIASTLDGKIALLNGESKWIGSKISRDFSQKLRLGSDAILVGINTVRKDDPRLTCRIEPKKKLAKVVLDSNLKTPLKAKVIREDNTIIFCSANGDQKIKQLTRKGVRVIRIKNGKKGLLPWNKILKELYKIGIGTVLIEGGATVASTALKAGIVDKFFLFLAPKLIGRGLSFTEGIRLKSLNQAIKLKEYRLYQIGPDILIEGYLK
ncbi:MAG: bifunctional diaminohydroxyphosphoribosylaminopyrimidine deaminase/5-amino-6-(5-phosphoribosylamino)uracil reductase RibD [candidate division WOR-3 bacterium]|nr:bifunctional diaminohydroxyphosphoribosylaminopyrimidine deaminase/5-amino-6-(5-phosphoribosylamino)uracil reductase RibD [candidate division WOR-3 bacterium]MDH5683447.1 bifunctional diaminohydroxyphosphoribosylaminopyrimidine deaminase/5-amino-6-(5-phosphoribosylamino)uracil reductase RibD [candidate division WOR-3 bacterium]